MILRHALLAVAVTSLSFAGVIVYPGLHPNFDAQIDTSPILATPFLSVALLNRQFPQWNYVEAAPNRIGFLNPEEPGRLIVWTTVISEADERQLALVAERPVDSSSYEQHIPPTPEPATLTLTGAGLLLAAWRLRVAGAARGGGPRRLCQ